MAKFDVYNMKHQKVREIDLPDTVFNSVVNEHVLHLAVCQYLANQRQGTAATKTRGLVSGGGRKPFRQKGTGRARQGSTRAPIYVGGGTMFGPTPRDYRQKMNKATKQVAIRSAISQKVKDQKVVIVDSITCESPKTKPMAQMLGEFGISNGLIVLNDRSVVIAKSFRNIPNISVVAADSVNVYDLMRFDHVMLTEDAAKKIGEVQSEYLSSN